MLWEQRESDSDTNQQVTFLERWLFYATRMLQNTVNVNCNSVYVMVDVLWMWLLMSSNLSDKIKPDTIEKT